MPLTALRIVHTVLHIVHRVWNRVEKGLLRSRHMLPGE